MFFSSSLSSHPRYAIPVIITDNIDIITITITIIVIIIIIIVIIIIIIIIIIVILIVVIIIIIVIIRITSDLLKDPGCNFEPAESIFSQSGLTPNRFIEKLQKNRPRDPPRRPN